MKHEFDALTKGNVSQEDYNMIEIVYMYHPAIQGKDDIVRLYMTYGMTVIMDMVPRSKAIAILESEVQNKRIEIEKLNEEMKKLR